MEVQKDLRTLELLDGGGVRIADHGPSTGDGIGSRPAVFPAY